MPETDFTVPAQGVFPTFTPPKPGEAGGFNALGAASDVVGLQKSLTDLQALRMTLAAKKKAGQIMAVAPSLDDGIAALHADPEVAGFVPDVISTLQGVSSAQTAQAGEKQSQATSGLNAVLGSLLPALNDPSTFDADIAGRLKVLSPSAQAAVTSAMPSLKAALFDGLSKDDPTLAAQQYQQRLAAMMVGAGFSADGVRAATGTLAPQIITVKDSQGRDVTMQVGGAMTGGPAGAISAGPTPAEQAQMTGEGSVAADTTREMSGIAENLPGALLSIDNAVKALSGVQTGGGADIRANAAKALQFFKNAGATGITDDMINQVGNGSLADSQVLLATLRNFVTNQLKEASQGTGSGRIKSEVDAFLSMADTTTDPAALAQILNQAKRSLRLEYDRAQAYEEFKKEVKDPSSEAYVYGPTGFFQWYNANKMNTENLPTVTPGGEDLGPVVAPEKPKTKTSTQSLDDIFSGM